MAAAGLAPLPVGVLVLVVLVDLVFALGDLDRVGRPEREGVDRAGGPAPAFLAMAVAGGRRIARDLDGHCTAEALSLVGVAHQRSIPGREDRRPPRGGNPARAGLNGASRDRTGDLLLAKPRRRDAGGHGWTETPV